MDYRITKNSFENKLGIVSTGSLKKQPDKSEAFQMSWHLQDYLEILNICRILKSSPLSIFFKRK